MPWFLRESVAVDRGVLQGFTTGITPGRYYAAVLGQQVIGNAVALRAVMLELAVVQYVGSPGQIAVIQDKIVWAQAAVMQTTSTPFGSFLGVYIPKNAPLPEYRVGLAEFVP